MVSRSWRCHMQRTPAGETPSPLPQLVGDAQLAEGRLLKGKRDDGVLDLLRYAVLQGCGIVNQLQLGGELSRKSPIAITDWRNMAPETVYLALLSIGVFTM